MLIQFAVRTFGPILLRGGLGGGATSTSNTNSNSKDDDFDDFDDDDNDDNEVVDSNKSKVSISLPTFAPDSSEDSLPTAVSSTNSARINLLDSFDDDVSSSTPFPSQSTTSVR